MGKWGKEGEYIEDNEFEDDPEQAQEIIESLRDTIALLNKKLEACKLKWQHGKPPEDGWYWKRKVFKYKSGKVLYYPQVCFYSYLDYSPSGTWGLHKWAGPISEPENE